jgi:peptide chain release factor 1
MLEKLAQIEQNYIDLEHRLASPDIFSNPEAAARLLKEQKELTPIVECYRAYRAAQQDAADCRELLNSETDADMRALAEEESRSASARMQDCEDQLRLLLLPRDPNDERSVIMEIRAGVGGEEAALFAADLYRMYSMYAVRRGWRTEPVYANETGIGGYKELSFTIEGAGAYSRLKFESGVHRVQRVPETESSGRIQTSAASVAVLPEADEVTVEIDPKELQIDTYRSSGAGGQHVNKTESAIRITHLPTGIVVECQDERSQYKNRDRAMKILASKLLEKKREEQDSAIAAERRSQVGSGDRSERIRTYNFPQGRVSDHRIGLTLHKLEQILSGDLDELIDALVTADQAERLRTQAESL